MEAKELIKLAYDMGAHPYSVGGMVAALQKGIEIGKAEQKVIDSQQFKEYLQKKKDSIDLDYHEDSFEYNESKYSLLLEIINELFKGD